MKKEEMMLKATQMLAKGKFKLKKAGPTIMIVGAAIGGVTAAVLACKATLKAEEIIAEHKFEGSITVVEPFYIDKEQNRLFYRKWVESCELAEKTYFLMLMNGYRPEQARCVLPLCLKTEIVVTANYREWRNIFKLRTPVAAHPQMRELMCPLLLEVQKKIPVVFDDIYTFWPADDQTRKGSMVKE